MTFDVEELAHRLSDKCRKIIFALLHGSASGGEVKPGSDIDLALYLSGKPDWELYNDVMAVVSSVAADAECDIGILNHAEPVYRFEALKGRLLFCRDMEVYLSFFSLAAREYETQMADYERQHRYRLAVSR